MEVRLDRINKSFGPVHVLRDVSLTIPSRQYVTLLGPSGCGKTTLLRMIAGLETVGGGEIRFGDTVVNALAPRDRNIAMVFQSYALYPQMTVAENIGYGLKVRGVPRAEIRPQVERVAQILEIGHLLDRKPKQLSGGQRQRVALGRAMVRKPDIFLMDEPLSNLDAKLRVTMRAELRRFHLDLQTTTIYVTHDQLEAMTMSDLIAVMNDGVVQQFGTPSEVYNHPASLFVAGFIGSPPMNFAEGLLSREEGGSLRIGALRYRLPAAYQAAVAGRPEGTKLVLGVRPQDVKLAPEGAGNSLAGEIWLIELVGSEKLIDVELAPHLRMVAEVKAEAPAAIGDRAYLALDDSKVHLFDPATGLVVPRASRQ